MPGSGANVPCLVRSLVEHWLFGSAGSGRLVSTAASDRGVGKPAVGSVGSGTLLGPEETGPFAWPLLSCGGRGGFVSSRAGLLPYRPGLVGGCSRVRVFGGGVGWLSGCCL
jgi:hypothetical protein